MRNSMIAPHYAITIRVCGLIESRDGKYLQPCKAVIVKGSFRLSISARMENTVATTLLNAAMAGPVFFCTRMAR